METCDYVIFAKIFQADFAIIIIIKETIGEVLLERYNSTYMSGLRGTGSLQGDVICFRAPRPAGATCRKWEGPGLWSSRVMS